MFKWRKKHIVDLMIEFEVLAIKIKIDNIYIIFFIEEEYQEQYYQNNIGIPAYSGTRVTQRVESSDYISYIEI